MTHSEDTVIRTTFGMLARRGAATTLSAVLMMFLSGCSGNSNSSGPAAPLPNSQRGSIVANALSNGNCYVTSTSAGFVTCPTPPYGTSGTTALAAGTVSSSNYLVMGNNAGDIALLPSPTTTPPPTSSELTACSTTGAATIKALAINTSGTGTLYAATSGGIYSVSLSSCSSSSFTSINTSITNATGLVYNPNYTAGVIGVTGNATYFTCTVSACTSHGLLPSLQDTSPQITAIASDPVYPIVYITAIGANTGRIYYYSVGTSGTLTYLGNYAGTELSAPSGLALFQGANPTLTYCTSGACTFLDVANPGNNTITQYVLLYSGSGTGTVVPSINQFNNAYFNCEIINPSSIAALPLPPTTGGSLNVPDVFVGENGTSLGPCMGIASVTFGNNVTAYYVKGE